MPDHAQADVLQRLLRPQVAGLPEYDPGADPREVARQYGLDRVVKLSNNENPLGLSPRALKMIEEFPRQETGRYPDPAGTLLCQALAGRHDIDPARVILGNGSENILELLCQAFLQPGERVVTQAPCFGLHEIFPAMMGATVDKVALSEAFTCDLPAWRVALVRPVKLVFISNPSNPAGSFFNGEQLLEIVQACPPDCVLVLDEAYYEYAIGTPDYPDAMELLRHQARPWIVLRTFSKAYGLAGLRVGYGLASHPALVEALHRVRTPYNVNHLAQQAALAALDDIDHLQRSVALVADERERIRSALCRAGYRVAPSRTNFLFIDTGVEATAVVQALLRTGVIVKAWREAGYQRFIRLSLGLPADNDLFLQNLLPLRGLANPLTHPVAL